MHGEETEFIHVPKDLLVKLQNDSERDLKIISSLLNHKDKEVTIYAHLIHFIPSETLVIKCNRSILDETLQRLSNSGIIVDDVRILENDTKQLTK